MRKIFYLPILILILGDIFLFIKSSDIRIIAILLIYIYHVRLFKLKSNTTFFLSLILLFFAYIQFLFIIPGDLTNTTVPHPAEKTAVWVFLFLVVGIIQKWIEFKKIK